MGCFSFKCQKCGRGIQSSSFSGEEAILFLIKEGKILQKMEGQYDSYGRVFIEGTQDDSVKHSLMKSQKWKNPETGIVDDRAWSAVCSLMFDNDPTSGIAALHKDCYDGVEPKFQSQRDPNQGWGEDGELMGVTDAQGYHRLPPIEGYNVEIELQINQLEEKIWRVENDLKMYDNSSWLKLAKKMIKELPDGEEKDRITKDIDEQEQGKKLRQEMFDNMKKRLDELKAKR